MALPLLESMVPAFTALAQTPAKRPLRFGAVYFPNGATDEALDPGRRRARATSSRRSSSRSKPFRNQSDRRSATCRAPAARP